MNEMGSEEESYLIVDIDSHHTKAALIERAGDGYRCQGTSEAPTTVDPPELDVTIGVERAIRGLGQKLGKELWTSGGPSGDHRLLCSSSTSGGIYMNVAGLIRNISTESAQRAALGAGALLMDVFSYNDRQPRFKIIERMRRLKPEIFLLAGGTDGGAEKQVIAMARLIEYADVKPRFGARARLQQSPQRRHRADLRGMQHNEGGGGREHHALDPRRHQREEDPQHSGQPHGPAT